MNILVFGDSIAWGAFDKKKGGWVERLKCFLFDYDCFVYNCGVSGNTSKDVLEDLDTHIHTRLSTKYDTAIIIAIGANDAGYAIVGSDRHGECITDVYPFGVNLAKICRAASSYAQNVCFIGLTPIDDSKCNPVAWDDDLNYSNNMAELYNLEIKKICKSQDVMFIDVFDAIDINDLSDGCHPNENGHKKIFKLVKDKISDWYQ